MSDYHTKGAFDARISSRRRNPVTPDPLAVFYHLSLMPGWEIIVAEQLRLLAHVGLNRVKAFVIASQRADVERLAEIAARYGVEVELLGTHYDFRLYEGPTLRELYRWCVKNPTGAALYLHTKGVSNPACPVKRDWRRVMMKRVVADWRANLALLQEFDAAGCAWQQSPDFPHFSGNIWMARADWIASLDEPENYRFSRDDFSWSGHSWRERMYVESWIGSKGWHHIVPHCGYDAKLWEHDSPHFRDLDVPGFDWDAEVYLGDATTHGKVPVRWWSEPGAVRAVDLADIPAAEWGGWEARYENDAEHLKRTTRKLTGLSSAVRDVFRNLRGSVGAWSTRLGYPVEDDPLLHGGGLHVTEPGGHLSTHLDYDRHPKYPSKRRAVNLIAFLNPEWRPEWGGALVLCDPEGKVVERIVPEPGKVVAFEVGDLSYHGVEPVTGPVPRVTAAVYFLSEAGPGNTRRRALFLPSRKIKPVETRHAPCRFCLSANTAAIPFQLPAELGPWMRCRDCGCDVSPFTYDEVSRMYDQKYLEHQLQLAGGIDGQVRELTTNLDLFDKYRHLTPNRDFLDVGCCEGGALKGMQDRGWSVHGFDVFTPPYAGPHTTIAPHFHRRLFPRQYSAVLCREVWEHVDDPLAFLEELKAVTLPGGLLQLQTPKPIDRFHGGPYQPAHLWLGAPAAVQSHLARAGLTILENLQWDLGQAYLCRV